MIEFVIDRTVTKRPCVYKKVGNTLYPIIYFHKAKNASNGDFEALYNYIIGKKVKFNKQLTK